MIKRFFLIAVIASAMIAIANPSRTAAQAFHQGNISVSAGYGVITFLGSLQNAYDTYNDTKYSQFGPLYLKGEYGVTDHIGLGLNVAYAQNKWAYTYESYGIVGYDSDGFPIYDDVMYTYADKRVTYSVLARVNYHIGSHDKFDPYLGFGLGYRNAVWSFETNDPTGEGAVTVKNLFPLGFEFTVGARYLVTPNLGLYAELGGSKSIFQGGVVLNIPAQ